MKLRLAPPILLFACIAAAPCTALEMAAARAPDLDRTDDWTSEGWGPCSIAYYNLCSGWVWIWSFEPSDRFGVAFGPVRSCTDYGSTIESTYLYCMTGSPAGYGLTGSVSIWDSDGTYPTVRRASQPYLPAHGWQRHDWHINCGPVPLLICELGAAEGNPATFATDQPARSGVPGVPACGTCFPETRTTHSWRWGSEESPLTPPEPFFDGVCNAELLAAVEGNLFDTEGWVSIESASWGQVKALYR